MRPPAARDAVATIPECYCVAVRGGIIRPLSTAEFPNDRSPDCVCRVVDLPGCGHAVRCGLSVGASRAALNLGSGEGGFFIVGTDHCNTSRFSWLVLTGSPELIDLTNYRGPVSVAHGRNEGGGCPRWARHRYRSPGGRTE